ncbi:hypothetical protein [Acinetobacter ursingii]|uniref:hypothetical protein n=1 Tax=Acinetobacter ursingii TaxID=108980 RepID=UPI00124DE482|nr:hypothetical protein [Acinetobacter ursingii]
MKKIFISIADCISLFGCGKNNSNTAVDQTQNKAEIKTENWQVIHAKDEMRGSENNWLATRSTNNADLSFPYDGENRLQLDVVDVGKTEQRLFLTIDKGQYDCASYGCDIVVKFGNAPLQIINFTRYDVPGNDGRILIYSPNSNFFIKNLENFNQITIEVPFYKDGTRQFKFDTSGFKKRLREIQ